MTWQSLVPFWMYRSARKRSNMPPHYIYDVFPYFHRPNIRYFQSPLLCIDQSCAPSVPGISRLRICQWRFLFFLLFTPSKRAIEGFSSLLSPWTLSLRRFFSPIRFSVLWHSEGSSGRWSTPEVIWLFFHILKFLWSNFPGISCNLCIIINLSDFFLLLWWENMKFSLIDWRCSLHILGFRFKKSACGLHVWFFFWSNLGSFVLEACVVWSNRIMFPAFYGYYLKP